MNAPGADQMRTVILVKLFQIRVVLEVVRVQIALLQRGVRRDVIREFHDFQRVALFFKNTAGRIPEFQRAGTSKLRL